MRHATPSAAALFLITLVAETPTSSEAAAFNRMVVVRTDVSYCLGVKDDNVLEGKRLELKPCNTSANSQKWDFLNNGRIRSNADTSLCVELNDDKEGNQFHLRGCADIDMQKFDYDHNSNQDITLQSDSSLALSFLGEAMGAKPVLLDEFQSDSNNQAWARVTAANYPPTQWTETSDDTHDEPQLAVLESNDEFCICATGKGSNSALMIHACDPNNDLCLWSMDNGEWYLKDNRDNFCVDSSGTRGRALYQKRCDQASNQWTYDGNKKICDSISGLCATYSDDSTYPSINDDIELNSDGEEFVFWDPPEYTSQVMQGRSFVADSHIVLFEDDTKCLGVASARAGAECVLVDCRTDDNKQLWTSTSNGDTSRNHIHLKEFQNLCIAVTGVYRGVKLRLQPCGDNQNQFWVFDAKNLNEISPWTTDSLCLSYQGSNRRRLNLFRANPSIVLTNCAQGGSESQAWFID